MQEELDQVKKERDVKIQEYQQKIDKDRENYN